MIAFLHTSKVHIDRFETLVRQFNPHIETKHFVNKTLLDHALAHGETASNMFREDIEAIQKEKPALLICTCSTYGSESDLHDGVYRIDQPIIAHLVEAYSKIGLVYTANSTKKVSENLILKTAKQHQKTITVVNCDCSEYWVHFENGDFDRYQKEIAKSILQMADQVEVIFLAQASMEGAKTHLTALEKPVFTSPEFGIKTLLQHL